MSKANFKFCLLLLVALPVCVFSQNQNTQNIKPASPEVAAFAKYLDIPVGYSSGTPQISIPFYTVKSGTAELPISLSYNASGIRVEETATWVGLGWNLSTGGTISRVVRGLPDDIRTYASTSYMQPGHFDIDSITKMDGTTRMLHFNRVTRGEQDSEPDLFSFSAMGYTGKFTFNQDSAKFILLPFQNIKIEYEQAGGTEDIYRFVLTFPNGTKCYFGSSPFTTPSNPVRESYEKPLLSYTTQLVNGVSSGPSASTGNFYYTVWSLMDVVTPTENKIHFYYTAKNSTEFGRGGENNAFVEGFPPNSNLWETKASFYYQYYSKPVIEKIEADNCDVFFVRKPYGRQDVFDTLNNHALDSIVIKTKNGQILKSFSFKYSYTTSTDAPLLWGLSAFQEVARKRMILDSVQEHSQGYSLPPYTFKYHPVALPSRLSASQDYWGYYNGKTNYNDLLMPALYGNEYPPTVVSTTVGMGTADRKIDTNYTKAGSLVQINYPTGGSTRYEYESNQALLFNSNITFFQMPKGVVRPDIVYDSVVFSPFPMPFEPPYPLYYTNTFTLIRPAGKTLIKPQLPPPCTITESSSCLVTIKIKSLPDSAISYTIKTTGNFYADLPAGDYKIEALINDVNTNPTPMFEVKLCWAKLPENPDNCLVGGLRVRKVVSADSAGKTIARSFKYNQTDSAYLNKSSGVIKGFPIIAKPTLLDYSYVQYSVSWIDQILVTGLLDTTKNYTSSGALPLTSEGQTVHYLNVTEFYDSVQTSFKTEYYYFDDFEYFVSSLANSVSIPPVSKEWRRVLNGKKQFEKNGSNYRILAEEKQHYFLYKPTTYLTGFRASVVSNSPSPQSYPVGAYIPYETASEWFLLDSTVSKRYSYQNGSTPVIQETVTRYYYNDQSLPSLTTTKNSKGATIHSKTWYPHDYNNSVGNNISTLKTKNIMGIPIKQETSVNGKTTSGSIVKYDATGQPIEIYAFENKSLPDTVAHNTTTYIPTDYQLKASLAYNGELLTQSEEKNKPTTAYIWGCDFEAGTGKRKNMQVHAVIENADSVSVAYTSFELQSMGNWTFIGTVVSTSTSPMGTKCYSLSTGAISKAGLTSGKYYIVSYWSSNGQYTVSGTTAVKQGRTLNGWTYYEHTVTGITTASVSGTGNIDELRLYPQKALMTTYAHQLGAGITALCDANNRITYYEYDVFNRLKLIKDQDGKVLKVYDYNYQQNTQY